MAITRNKFSPSINIIRDSDFDFDYIATPNSSAVFTQIFSEALLGNKVHCIIGSYGTGKSSLLLAIKQTLSSDKKHFKGHDTLINQLPDYKFIPIVGDYLSLTHYISGLFNFNNDNYTSSAIFKALDNYYKQLKKEGKGLAILIDEFGKFLEFASKNNPESELYFIQQLAEWVNNPKNDTILITTLHQDFNTYALALSKNQKQEWDKIKGRFKEIVFNEPVEQLLFLAAERIAEKFAGVIINKNFDNLFDRIKASKAFPLRNQLEKDFAQKLYPFDILSAAVLTLSLQEYGQNERSLFSFIESRDYFGINDFVGDKQFYSLAHVYDYLINNYYTAITSQYNNRHFTQLATIRTTLEKLEFLFTGVEYLQASTLIKSIGLLNIFSSNAATLDFNFYCSYGKLALGIKNPEEVIRLLETHKVIRFQGYNCRYIFSEATDLNIQVEIDAAGKLIEKAANFLENLNQHFDFPYIPAKAAFYEKGTPRFFQFKLTSEPTHLIPEGEIDGFINLIFNDDPVTIKKIEEFSRNCNEAILFGYYKNTTDIQNTLFEIQKVRKVIKANYSDKSAVKALTEIEEHYVQLLNHYVLDCLYSDNGYIIWFYKGERKKIKGRQALNKHLSEICKNVYFSTPIFKNELINKTKVSGQISMARNKLINRLLTDIEKENIGFTNTEFPPEKTIFLSLLENSKIHGKVNGVWGWQKPVEDNNISASFIDLWEAGELFLESTKCKERSLQEFIDVLLTKPFKLKQGLVDIWLPVFLLCKNDEYALYESNMYLPQLNGALFELISKKPELFKIKAFDVAGVKLELFNRYRILLNQAESNKPTNKLFIQTIKPFLAFYRDLPEYSKKTNRLNKKTIALRAVIATAKDPEKAFFDDFPTALGFSLNELQSNKKNSEMFIWQMQEAIKELRTCHNELIDRIETFLITDLFVIGSNSKDYKVNIREHYKGIKAHLLLGRQKSFYNKLLSPLDDRKAWLNSLVQSSIGKALNNITDEEEVLLYDKIRESVYELDNLCEISQEDAIEQEEDIVKIEITSFVQGLQKNLLRVPKVQSKEMQTRINNVRNALSKDKKLNITVLAKLLQELLKNE